MKQQPLVAMVFSKDRPLQLEGLLRSLWDHWTIPIDEVAIVCRHTTPEFRQGYLRVVEAVETEHKELKDPRTKVTWLEEGSRGSFRDLYEKRVSAMSPNENVVFFTDDDIVYQPLVWGPEVYAEFDPAKHLFLSTRLDRRFLLAHNDNLPPGVKKTPEFTREEKTLLEWEWRKAPWSPWNYAFSVEGTVYNAGLLQQMHSQIGYRAPNTYECEGVNWCNHHRVPELALSPVQACTFGNNVNITQTEWLTPVGTRWSMEKMNQEFLKGRKLNLEWFYDHAEDITDCHHIIEADEILTP